MSLASRWVAHALSLYDGVHSLRMSGIAALGLITIGRASQPSFVRVVILEQD